MVEIDLIQFIDQNISQVTSDETADEFLWNLVLECMKYAMSEFTQERYPDMNGVPESELKKDGNDLMLVPMIRKLDEYWKYSVTHIRERYGISLYRFTDLVMTTLLAKMPVQYSASFSDNLYRSTMAYAETMSGSDKKIDQVKNMEKLSEFFQLFQGLKVYYPEQDMYESEEDKEKFQRMNHLYHTLITGED